MNNRSLSVFAVALLLLPVAIPLIPSAAAAAPGIFGSGTPTFAMYPGPANLVDNDGEPSIGVNHNTGAVMFTGSSYVNSFYETRVLFDDSTTPATATWADVTPFGGIVGNIDPILYTDPVTGRTWAGGLDGACSILYMTDDDGESWTPGGNACVATLDHESIASGPYHEPRPSDASYDRAVYYCAQAQLVTCAASYDGGLTYTVTSLVACEYSNPAFHGSLTVSEDGTVWLPFGQGTDHICLAKSTDNGASWTDITLKHLTAPGGFDPDVATTPSNWVYIGYPEASGKAYVALSKDAGASWTYSPDLGAEYGLKTTTFHEMVAGDDERAALAFLGTTSCCPGQAFSDLNWQATWHLYVAYTYDGGATWDTIRASEDPVQRGCIWDGGGNNDCRNLLDFMDAQMDEEGRVLVGFADGCMGACALPGGTNGQSRSTHGTIARQTTGKGLLAAFDAGSVTIAAPLSGSAGSTLTLEATATVSTPYTATVSWGDGSPVQTFAGQTSAAFSASHVYLAQGTYTVTLNVVGAQGETASDTTSATVSGTGTGGGAIRIDAPTEGQTVNELVHVTGVLTSGPGNTAPVAAFTSSVSGMTATFDGTGSSDADGDALTYAWSFGDGAIATGATAAHTYTASGTYEACLSVSDGALQSSVCHDITVASASTFLLSDPADDARAVTLPAGAGQVGYNVPALDVLQLDGSVSAEGEPVLTMTVADLSLAPPTTEGADGASWMIQWTGPQGTDYVRMFTFADPFDPLGEPTPSCQWGYDDPVNGLVDEGAAPCTYTLGANGKITLTYPTNALTSRGYAGTTELESVTVINGITRVVAVFYYDTTTTASFPLNANGAAWTDVAQGLRAAAKPAPTSPPAYAQVPDDSPGDPGDSVAHLDVEAAWFDSDAENLYVGMKVRDIAADPTTTAFTTYQVAFVPSWTPADATWGGPVTSGRTLVNLRALVAFSPAHFAAIGAVPTTQTAPQFELQAVMTDGTRNSFGRIALVDGSMDPATDIVWFVVPRSALQNPPGGATLGSTEASTGTTAAGLGTLNGVDTTGPGDTYAFPSVQDPTPAVTLAAAPATGAAPLDVTFTTGVAPADVATWSVTYGDGATESGVVLPATLRHVYASAGTYTATLTVTDGDGDVGTAQTSVTATSVTAEPRRVLVQAGSLPAIEATCVDACLAWSADLDLSELAPGDVVIEARLVQDGVLASTDSVQVTYEPSESLVIDAPESGASLLAGDVTISGRIAQVTDRAPQATLTADRSSGPAPLAVQFSLAGMDDLGLAGWTLAFGDGQVTSGTTLPTQVSHTYANPGSYTPTLHVTDTGGNTGTDAIAIQANAGNTAPTTPSAPVPPSGATKIGIPVTLSWTSTDADGDALSFDVYLDTTDAATLVAQDQTSSFAPAGLAPNTTYYWRVVASDGTETTTGPIWSFTTAAPVLGEAQKPHVVIAFVDTGIFPYHQEFRRPELVADPATYLTDFHPNAKQINLCFFDNATKTVDQSRCPASPTAAPLQDVAEWQAKARVTALGDVGEGAGTLHWFPGTNVMSVSFNHAGDARFPTLDGTFGGGDSHGTAVGSDAAGATTGSCPECIIVMIEGTFNGDLGDSFRWAANQPWIDIVSTSTSTGPAGHNPGDVVNDEAYAQKEIVEAGKLFFAASGNGAGFADLGAPTTTLAFANFNPWTISVGCANKDTGQPCLYSDYPNSITAMGERRKSADADTWNGVSDWTGTSMAAPTAAGVAGRALLAARTALNDTGEGPAATPTKTLVRIGADKTAPATGPLANGALTRLELEEALFKTSRREENVVPPREYPLWTDFPNSPATFVKEGYGDVYRGAYGVAHPTAQATWSSAGDIASILLGQKDVPNRWLEEFWWEGAIEPLQESLYEADVPETDTDAYPRDDPQTDELGGYQPAAAAPRVKQPEPALRATITPGAVPTAEDNRLYLHHNVAGTNLYEKYINSVRDPVVGTECTATPGSPAPTTCPDRSGVGGTNPAAASFEYTVLYPTLGGTLALSDENVHVHVVGSAILGDAPAVSPTLQATLTANGALVGTGSAVASVVGNRAVYDIRFAPLVDLVSDPVVLTITAPDAHSLYVQTRGQSWMDLPIKGVLPPTTVENVRYYVDDVSTLSTYGDTLPLTRLQSDLEGDADAGSYWYVPWANEGLAFNLQANDVLVDEPAYLASSGSASFTVCANTDAPVGGEYRVKLALSAGGVPLGGGSVTTNVVGPGVTRVTVPLAMHRALLPVDAPLVGTLTFSGAGGVFAENLGVCGGGQANPWTIDLGIESLDAPTATIDEPTGTLSGTVTIDGTATFPARPDLASVTWFATDFESWDTTAQTFTLDTTAPGGEAAPLFPPWPNGYDLTFVSARPVAEDAPALAPAGVGVAQMWVTGFPVAPQVTVDVQVLLQDAAGATRTLGTGSLTKNVVLPYSALDTGDIWFTDKFVVSFTPQVTDPAPDEKLVMLVSVSNLQGATLSTTTCICGDANTPILVSLPKAIGAEATEPTVELALGDVVQVVPVVDGAWTATVDTRAVANGAHELVVTPRASYAGVERSGMPAVADVTVQNLLNRMPTASLALTPTSGVAPLAVTATLSGSDAETLRPALAWTLAWGDGAVSSGTGLPATASHVYQTVGSFDPVLTVRDTSGGTATADGDVQTLEAAAVRRVVVILDDSTAVEAVDDAGDGTFAQWHATIPVAQLGLHTASARQMLGSATQSEASVVFSIRDAIVPIPSATSHTTGALVTADEVLEGATSLANASAVDVSTDADFANAIAATSTDGFQTWSVPLAALGLAEDVPTTLYLRATGDEGQGYGTLEVTLDAAPNVRIAATGLPATSGDAVQFAAETTPSASGAAIVSWLWDFGDAQTSPEVNPTHAYGMPGVYPVTLTVMDANGATAAATLDALVLNRAPSVTLSDAPSLVTPLDDVRIDVFATDYEGSALTYAITVYDGTTRDAAIVASGTDSALTLRFPDDGEYLVVGSATDADGATGEAEAVFAIANARPIATLAASATRVGTDSPVTLDASGSSDPDGSIVEYTFDLGDGTTLTQSEAMLQHEYTASGTYLVTVTVVDDDGGAITSDALAIVVNAAPILAPIGNQVVAEEETLSFTAAANDAENDPLTWSIDALPAGATFDTATGAFAWTPTLEQSGNYPVNIAVTDGLSTDSEAFIVSVGNVDLPPALAPIGDQSGHETDLLTFVVSAADADTAVLTYSMTGDLPAAATLGENTGIFAWTPTYADAGVYHVTFAVTDGTTTDSESVVITIANLDRAPTLQPIAPTTAKQLTPLAIPLRATDADGDSIAFALLSGPTGATVRNDGNGQGAIVWTPGIDTLGTYEIVVAATSADLATTRTTTVTVLFNTSLTLTPVVNVVKASPLQVVRTDVVLTNTGPQPDTFAFTATNDEGWTLSAVPEPVTLAPGETYRMTLTTNVPANGALSFTSVTAKSLGDETTTKLAKVRIEVPVNATIVVEKTSTVVLDLPRGTVIVTYLDGTPAKGASVAITQTPGTGGAGFVSSDAGFADDNGVFAWDFSDDFRGLLPGKHTLFVSAKMPDGIPTTARGEYRVGA